MPLIVFSFPVTAGNLRELQWIPIEFGKEVEEEFGEGTIVHLEEGSSAELDDFLSRNLVPSDIITVLNLERKDNAE